jgi:hypothetical protein
MRLFLAALIIGWGLPQIFVSAKMGLSPLPDTRACLGPLMLPRLTGGDSKIYPHISQGESGSRIVGTVPWVRHIARGTPL